MGIKSCYVRRIPLPADRGKTRADARTQSQLRCMWHSYRSHDAGPTPHTINHQLPFVVITRAKLADRTTTDPSHPRFPVIISRIRIFLIRVDGFIGKNSHIEVFVS
ncbi:hypothetical protein GW17_00055684 [Ensete ventricosum]|nr:hypothetical protein GW17_00055684 [Ensete ventricosum]